MLQPKTRQFRASLTLESLVTKLRIPSHKYANSVLEYLNWLKLFSYILCNRSKTNLHYNLLEIFVKQTDWDVELHFFIFDILLEYEAANRTKRPPNHSCGGVARLLHKCQILFK